MLRDTKSQNSTKTRPSKTIKNSSVSEFVSSAANWLIFSKKYKAINNKTYKLIKQNKALNDIHKRRHDTTHPYRGVGCRL